jgi:hypothetical protein
MEGVEAIGPFGGRGRAALVHKARSFKEADAYDVRQQRAMTPQQRMVGEGPYRMI